MFQYPVLMNAVSQHFAINVRNVLYNKGSVLYLLPVNSNYSLKNLAQALIITSLWF